LAIWLFLNANENSGSEEEKQVSGNLLVFSVMQCLESLYYRLDTVDGLLLQSEV